jgi:hypothetical protein
MSRIPKKLPGSTESSRVVYNREGYEIRETVVPLSVGRSVVHYMIFHNNQYVTWCEGWARAFVWVEEHSDAPVRIVDLEPE